MDSKNIYISSQRRLKIPHWSDFIYVGLNHDNANEYQAEKVAEYAYSIFNESEVYVVRGRHDSHLALLEEALSSVSSWPETADVLLCNKAFTRAMKLYSIGVMRYGPYAS